MTRRKGRGAGKTYPVRSTGWIPRRKPTDVSSTDDAAGHDDSSEEATKKEDEKKGAAKKLEQIDQEIDKAIANAQEIRPQISQRQRGGEASHGSVA